MDSVCARSNMLEGATTDTEASFLCLGCFECIWSYGGVKDVY